jgi:hypothetical protein
MANVAGFVSSFKREVLCGIHAFGATVVRAATTKDSFKAAAYLSSASLGPGTTAYTITGECTGAGYVAGGVAVTNGVDPAEAGGVAYWTPSASIVFAGVTIGPTDAVLLYNQTQANRAVGVFSYNAVSVVAGTLTLSMPVNAPATALVQVA